MGFSREIKRIKTQSGDRIALIRIKFDFQTHPGAVIHADIATTSGNQLANLRFGQIHTINVDNDTKIEPIDFLVHDLKTNCGGHRIGQNCLELLLDVQLEVIGHGFNPLGEFLGKLLGDPPFKGLQLLVIGQTHF